MSFSTTELLESMTTLGSPDELRRNPMDPGSFRHNAHVHLPPNFSAFDTIDQVVEMASREGLSLLGASNYYDYSVYVDFGEKLWNRGIFPLFGLEIIAMDDALLKKGHRTNDPGNPGKVYICGKGISRFLDLTPTAASLLSGIRQRDSRRMERMAEALNDAFENAGIATSLNSPAIIARVVERHGSPIETVYLQERHLSQAFQERFFELVPVDDRRDVLANLLGVDPKANPDDNVGIQGEIRSHLMKAGKACYVDESFDTIENARTLILEMGGIPSYPVLADGVTPVCEFESSPADLADALIARGFHAAEFIPIRNTPEVLLEYTKVLHERGLVVTAGTEHNTLDQIPLDPKCLGGAAIPEEAAAIYREGTCLVAAHQYLTMRGEAGFLNPDGSPRGDDKVKRELCEYGATLIAAGKKRQIEGV